MSIPSYLSDYKHLYEQDPRLAALTWYREAGFGLFLHYGLYSLLGRHEWVQLREKIPVAEMERVAGRFTAEGFDAAAITDLACEAGMRYVNMTTRHHDSFCLFHSEETAFHTGHTPCARDLVAEMADACRDRGLGLCLYYSHGRDWRHPHAPNNDRWGGCARPEYDPPEPSYAYGDNHDLQRYLDFITRQITELLTQYGPIASIWLDGIAVPLSGDPNEFHLQELYDHIHSLQSQVLVSYKQGVTGTEDYFAPEHGIPKETDKDAKRGQIGQSGDKTIEVCTTMCPGSWGYSRQKAGQHLTADQVWEKLQTARTQGYNLLLNTGPLPDGSIDPEDAEVLREIGRRQANAGIA